MRSKNKAARKMARSKRQAQTAHAKAMVALGPVPDVYGVESLVTRLETGWAAKRLGTDPV